jgi:hypothetical protein
LLGKVIFINGLVSPRIYKTCDGQLPDNQQTYCTGLLEEKICELEEKINFYEEENGCLRSQLCNLQIAYSQLSQLLICQEYYTGCLSSQKYKETSQHRQPVYWHGASGKCNSPNHRRMAGSLEGKINASEPQDIQPYWHDGKRFEKIEQAGPEGSSSDAGQNRLIQPSENEPPIYMEESSHADSNVNTMIEKFLPEEAIISKAEESDEAADIESEYLSADFNEIIEADSNLDESSEESIAADDMELDDVNQAFEEEVDEADQGQADSFISDWEQQGGASAEFNFGDDELIESNSISEEVQHEKAGDHASPGEDDFGLLIEQDAADPAAFNSTEEFLPGTENIKETEMETMVDSPGSQREAEKDSESQLPEKSEDDSANGWQLAAEGLPLHQVQLIEWLFTLPPNYPVDYVYTEKAKIKVIRFEGLNTADKLANFISKDGLVSIPFTDINGIVFPGDK